jgi:hypothetical protein
MRLKIFIILLILSVFTGAQCKAQFEIGPCVYNNWVYKWQSPDSLGGSSYDDTPSRNARLGITINYKFNNSILKSGLFLSKYKFLSIYFMKYHTRNFTYHWYEYELKLISVPILYEKILPSKSLFHFNFGGGITNSFAFNSKNGKIVVLYGTNGTDSTLYKSKGISLYNIILTIDVGLKFDLSPAFTLETEFQIDPWTLYYSDYLNQYLHWKEMRYGLSLFYNFKK